MADFIGSAEKINSASTIICRTVGMFTDKYTIFARVPMAWESSSWKHLAMRSRGYPLKTSVVHLEGSGTATKVLRPRAAKSVFEG